MAKLLHAERLQGVNARLVNVIREASAEARFDITVSEGLRTKARQEQLYKEGKSKTLNSKHLTGNAVDLYPLAADGQINWTGFGDLVRLMKKAANKLNTKITCGYDWGWDKPHFELS
jgi:peptidoglycan L-alanyl-D-glutamate endopeptidase CwlK